MRVAADLFTGTRVAAAREPLGDILRDRQKPRDEGVIEGSGNLRNRTEEIQSELRIELKGTHQ